MRSSGPSPIDSPRIATGLATLSGHSFGRVTPVRDFVLMAGLDEAGEQRMRLQRLRLELGMELHRHVPRMARQLDDLDELAVLRAADDLEPGFGERALEEAVELVAMTVPLLDQRLAVERPG